MSILESIRGPRDLDGLSRTQLEQLASEIREFLVRAVSKTGGHLGPNLGVVELSIAMHRVFDSPHDAIVFDTGHQSYVHKLLTGRQDFERLRDRGGLAGYPQRAESEHDIVESSHASSSLSWADGISRAFAMTGQGDRYVVAVVGDGALTGGMTWEALNNISDDNSRRLVMIVNDNGRSYAPTIGGMARFLNTVRTRRAYRSLYFSSRRFFDRLGRPGRAIYRGTRGAIHGFLSRFSNNEALYSNLDIKYLGPVDGHDLRSLEEALRQAKSYDAPVIVHVITQKGRGYQPALADLADQFHAVGQIDPETGEPLEHPSRPSWTSVFADEIVELATREPRLVGITAAMLRPTGLHKFAERFPDRVFDVGIAEQHAATSAAGLAFGGLHPVVALYATFVNRAFDQVLMDVALHRAGVTFVLDRAGVTGPDGPSHHGMWDLAILQVVPGIRIAAPRDATRLREELAEAVAIDDGPTVMCCLWPSAPWRTSRCGWPTAWPHRASARRSSIRAGSSRCRAASSSSRAPIASSSRSRTASASEASERASARTCAPPASTRPSTSSGSPTSSSITPRATRSSRMRASPISGSPAISWRRCSERASPWRDPSRMTRVGNTTSRRVVSPHVPRRDVGGPR